MEPETVKTPLRNRVPEWARAVLQVISLLRCLSLGGNLLTLMFTADLRQVATQEGFSALVDTFFSSYMEQLKSPGRSARTGRLFAARQQESLNFLDPESLVNWTYGLVKDIAGEDAPITRDNVRTFLAESTVKDFLAGKITDAVSGIFSEGQVEDLLTASEVETLIEENKELLHQQFGLDIAPESLQTIVTLATGTLENSNLNGQFRDFMEKYVKGDTPILFGISGQDVVRFLVKRLTGSVLRTKLITCIVLVVLLCLANFYNIPAGLTWAGFPCLITGGIMALAIGLLSLPASMASLQPVLDVAKAMIAPVHHTVLGVGAALLLAGIVWRVVRSCVAKKQAAAAPAV